MREDYQTVDERQTQTRDTWEVVISLHHMMEDEPHCQAEIYE